MIVTDLCQLPTLHRKRNLFSHFCVGVTPSHHRRHAINYEAIQTEWPQLSTFWQESIARDYLLSTAPEGQVVVQRRSVFPTTLMGDELKETPGNLPNDCIARYYGKSSVVLAPANKSH